MPTRNRVPAAIEPLLQLPPESSLILLTGTLGCSPVWVTTRFVGDALGQGSGAGHSESQGHVCSVVLVSWMRDLAFWKNEIKRAMGVDVAKAIEKMQMVFIDCLPDQYGYDKSDSLTRPERAIMDAIRKVEAATNENRILLVLDSPDVLLASGSTTAQHLNSLLLKLRSPVHSVVLTCSTDQPLLNAATQNQQANALPLETESARFTTQQAHNARFVLSVRELATGSARDVSGVLRVTRSGCSYDIVDDALPTTQEMEALYLVQRDGGVKVFQRGSDMT